LIVDDRDYNIAVMAMVFSLGYELSSQRSLLALTKEAKLHDFGPVTC
jgi:hypothetical protein